MSESLPNWDAYLNVASLSDIGMRRTNNQDNMTISLANSLESWQRKGHLFVVADGMGAHAAGELASKIAVDHIPHIYGKFNDIPAAEALRKSVMAANTEIHRRGQANEDFHNMGTTCSAIALLPQGAVVAHIGDSRVYLLRQNRLEQLTFDHSLVWEMRASGQLSAAEEASGKIPKNVITRSLGPYADCKVDLEGPFQLGVGDKFLLCSDGLTGMLDDEEIGSIMSNMPPDEAVRVLVDLANLRGGPDNTTVIIIEVKHPDMAMGGAPVSSKPSSSNKSKIHPLTWALLGGGLVAAAVFYFMFNWMVALVPVGVAAIALIWLLIQLAMNSTGFGAAAGGKRYGKGPYTRANATAGGQFVKQLANILEQLRAAGTEKNWPVNWDQLGQLVSSAEAAATKNDFPTAVRAYGRSISFLMDQLRNQKGGDSTVDL